MMQHFNDNTLMPFGEHKGTKLANVPARYLIYIYENYVKLAEPLKIYIRDNLDVLKVEKKRTAQKQGR